MLLKQTKIVASISDRRCDVDFIKELFDAGMNVVRMNTAHASREGFEALIANVRTVSNRIAILMDTKGPEVRTTANAEPILYQIGEKVKIVGDPERETTRECIAVSYPNFVHDLNIGGTILIDDGDLELRVIDKTSEYLLCEVQNEATLGSRKSVNVPGVRINLPSLTEKDRNNILYAIEKDIVKRVVLPEKMPEILLTDDFNILIMPRDLGDIKKIKEERKKAIERWKKEDVKPRAGWPPMIL